MVYNINNPTETFRTSVKELKNNNELVFYRTGFKHTEQTKKKMSNNGVKNRKLYNDGKSEIYLKDSEEIPEGFVLGYTDNSIERISEQTYNKRWYHNPKNNEQIRLKDSEEIPEGFVLGRLKKNDFVGWDKINNLYIRILDLKEKKYKTVLKTNELKHHEIKLTGIKLTNIVLYKFKGEFFIRKGDLLYSKLNNKFIKTLLKNNSFENLGIEIYNIKDFKYNSNIIITPFRKDFYE